MASQCLKSTKANERSFARIQTLTLDTVRPLSKVLEKLNSEVTDIDDVDEIGYAVKSTIMLIGNTSSQMSALQRQRLLEKYSLCARDGGRIYQGSTAALWGAVPKGYCQPPEQVMALWRARSSNSQGFRKAPSSQWLGQQSYAPRQYQKLYARPRTGYKKKTKTQKWQSIPECQKVLNIQNPIMLEWGSKGHQRQWSLWWPFEP